MRSESQKRDTIGSVVELLVEGLPIGVGEPWFDGIEPSLARALMAIPGARAVEFSHGVKSSTMRGVSIMTLGCPEQTTQFLMARPREPPTAHWEGAQLVLQSQ